MNILAKFAWDSSGKLYLAFTISCNCSSYRLQGEEVGDNEGKTADGVEGEEKVSERPLGTQCKWPIGKGEE